MAISLKSLKRKQEYEADRLVLDYLARAGFNPSESTYYLSFLERGESVEGVINPRDRIYQVKTAIKSLNVENMKSAGEENIRKSPFLSYKKFSKSRSAKGIIITANSTKSLFEF